MAILLLCVQWHGPLMGHILLLQVRIKQCMMLTANKLSNEDYQLSEATSLGAPWISIG